MSGWKPIETAPRDGTRILIVGDDDSPKMVVIGCQYRDDVTPGCFDTIIGDWWPTHWMPLPEPPEVSA